MMSRITDIPKLKRRFPWKLGASSCVIPADIMANVRLLAPFFDDIQLLFFESAAKSRLPQPLDLAFLSDQPVGYTVHLPTDLSLGSASPAIRREGIDEILRLMELLAPLDPSCYDLHLNREANCAEDAWLDYLAEGLDCLAAALGDAKKLLAVENIDFPFAQIARLVEDAGLGICLDLGHLARYGHLSPTLTECGERLRHLHLHGMEGGRDHRALCDRRAIAALLMELAATGFTEVLTLELYRLEYLTASLHLLEECLSDLSLHSITRKI